MPIVSNVVKQDRPRPGAWAYLHSGQFLVMALSGNNHQVFMSILDATKDENSGL